MPEFILDHGSTDGTRAFAALDSFTQGYVEAMFFTSTGYAENDDLETASVAELAPETWAKIQTDCDAFIATFDTIEAGADDASLSVWPDDEHAGRDFWYTRNRHGCGFWDGDWPEPHATALTDAAHAFPEISLTRGDDGQIYLE